MTHERSCSTFTAFGLVVQRFLVLVNSVIALAYWCFPPRFALSSAFLDIPRARFLKAFFSVKRIGNDYRRRSSVRIRIMQPILYILY